MVLVAFACFDSDAIYYIKWLLNFHFSHIDVNDVLFGISMNNKFEHYNMSKIM